MSNQYKLHPEGTFTGKVMSMQAGWSVKHQSLYAAFQVKTEHGGVFVPVGIEYLGQHLASLNFGRSRLTIKVTHTHWEKNIRLSVTPVGAPSV
jgi:hypothetical protein